MKKCKNCGTEFHPTNRKQKYCSIICNIKDNIAIDSNECWNWIGFKSKGGYGQFTNNSVTRFTHRVMCESTHGPAPKDKQFTLHACDNRACCNPDHLRWGSHQDNMDDMKERYKSVHGVERRNAKLTEEQVIEIIEKLKNFKNGDYVKIGKEYM